MNIYVSLWLVSRYASKGGKAGSWVFDLNRTLTLVDRGRQYDVSLTSLLIKTFSTSWISVKTISMYRNTFKYLDKFLDYCNKIMRQIIVYILFNLHVMFGNHNVGFLMLLKLCTGWNYAGAISMYFTFWNLRFKRTLSTLLYIAFKKLNR